MHLLHVDSSYCGHTRKGAFAYVFRRSKGHKVYEYADVLSSKIDSSVIAEQMGVISALKHAYKERIIRKGDTIEIRCDCDAIGLFVQFYKKTKLVLELQEFVVENRLNLVYQHVKGHSAIEDIHSLFNKSCDTWAKRALESSLTEIDHYIKQQGMLDELKRRDNNKKATQLYWNAKRNEGLGFRPDLQITTSENKLEMINHFCHYFKQYSGKSVKYWQLERWLILLCYQNEINYQYVFDCEHMEMLIITLSYLGVFKQQNKIAFDPSFSPTSIINIC